MGKRATVPDSQKITFPRHYTPACYDTLVDLYALFYALEKAYGSVAYLRIEKCEEIQAAFVIPR